MSGRGQNIEVHRRACVYNTRKNKCLVSSSAKASCDGKVITDITSMDLTKKGMISHFSSEPVLDGDLIQGAIAEVATKQVADEQPRQFGSEQTKKDDKMTPRLDARDVKELEIQKAMRSASSVIKRTHRPIQRHSSVQFGLSKLFLALTCALIIVIGIIYLVDNNSPNVSLKVAAMQTGINAVYPKYTPRGYMLSDVTSESGRVVLNFCNTENNNAYSLTEDDVEALLNEDASALSGEDLLLAYVDGAFGVNYNKVNEQGVSVYVGNNGAAWISGGILFKLKVKSGSLTRKQMVTIATSK